MTINVDLSKTPPYSINFIALTGSFGFFQLLCQRCFHRGCDYKWKFVSFVLAED
jgi:hypothetical protein